MNILVLGGTGLVGRYLMGGLAKQGHQIDVISRRGAELRCRKVITADISQPNWIERNDIVLAHYDAIFHLAYANRSTPGYNRVVTVASVEEICRALTAANRSSPCHLIYVGSMVVFGMRPSMHIVTEDAPRVADSEYAQNKIDATQLAMRTSPGWFSTVMHPTGVYDATSERIADHQELLAKNYLPRGGLRNLGVINIVHAADVANALVLALHRSPGAGSKEFIINAETIPYDEWFSSLAKTVAPRYRLRMPEFVRRYCRGPIREGLNRLRIGCPLYLHGKSSEALRRTNVYSAEKARRELGFVPGVLFREFCDELAAHRRRVQ